MRDAYKLGMYYDAYSLTYLVKVCRLMYNLSEYFRQFNNYAINAKIYKFEGDSILLCNNFRSDPNHRL